MLPKSKRLSRDDFKQIQGKKTIIHGSFFKLTFSPCSGGMKFAVVIQKKIVPLSVDRHLVKRRVMESIQQLIPSLSPEHAQYVILYARSEVIATDFKLIQQEITTLFTKARMLQ